MLIRLSGNAQSLFKSGTSHFWLFLLGFFLFFQVINVGQPVILKLVYFLCNSLCCSEMFLTTCHFQPIMSLFVPRQHKIVLKSFLNPNFSALMHKNVSLDRFSKRNINLWCINTVLWQCQKKEQILFLRRCCINSSWIWEGPNGISQRKQPPPHADLL